MTDPRTWSCFGALWSEEDTQCTGGFDVGYRNPSTGSNLRTRCSAFDACKLMKEKGVISTTPYYPPQYQQTKPPAVAQTYPTHQFGPPRPPSPPSPPQLAAPQQIHSPYTYPPQQQYAHPQHLPMVNHGQAQYAHPYYAQFGATSVPVQFQQPGSQIPAYLAVPEPVDQSIPFLSRLLAEVIRALAKAGGHALASFFDHNPLRPHAPPPMPQQPQQQQFPPNG